MSTTINPVPTDHQRNEVEATAQVPPVHVPSSSKEVILDTAQNLLAHHGYAGLSMRELAAESGLAKATIYHHFQDKDALFRSVLERDMTMVHAQLMAAAADASGAVAKITTVVRVYASLMRERRTVIMSVLRELSQETSDLCTFIHERRHQYVAPITAILQEGINEGVFRPIDIEQTAISLIGMINAFMIFADDERALTPDERSRRDEHFIEHTVQLFLFGISV